jgi:hypothetical protein
MVAYIVYRWLVIMVLLSMLFDDMVIENVIIIDEGLLRAINIVNVMTN